MDKACQRLYCGPDRWLLANNECDRAEIRKPAASCGHAKSKIVDVRGGRGRLKQIANAAHSDAQIWVVKTGLRELGLSQHAFGLDAHRSGDLRVMGQARAAN